MKTLWRRNKGAQLTQELHEPQESGRDAALGTDQGMHSASGSNRLPTVLLWGLLLGSCTLGVHGCSSTPPEPAQPKGDCCYIINSPVADAYAWWHERLNYRTPDQDHLSPEFFREFNWRK